MSKNALDSTAALPLKMTNEVDGSNPPRYSFANAPLTPGGMVPLIREVLVNERPLKRIEIRNRVVQMHLDRGGAETDGLVLKIKRALEILKENREIESVAFGRYIATNLSHQDFIPDIDTDEDTSELDIAGFNEATNVVPTSLAPLDEVGKGPQKVYVYYFANDRDLAQLKGNNTWPCKIGYTTTSVTERILAQGVTAMHSLPLVGLVIHTHNADLVERSIHNALRLAGRTMASSPRAGAEWFNTTPDDIKAWYVAFIDTLSFFQRTQTVTDNVTSTKKHGDLTS